jgi:hypothetical protein
MKKVIGYGYKLESESIESALHQYPKGYASSKAKVMEDIEENKRIGSIEKGVKVKIFKVTVETI